MVSLFSKKMLIEKASMTKSMLPHLFAVFCITLIIPAYLYIIGPSETNILDVPIVMFWVGLIGTLFAYKNKNILIFIMCIETMLLSIVLGLVIISIVLQDTHGQIYALCILALAACETAIGLGLIVNCYRTHKTLEFARYRALRVGDFILHRESVSP